MQTSATDAIRRHERPPATDRQRRPPDVMAESHRDLRRPKEQVVADAIAQLVWDIGGGKNGGRIAPGAAADGYDASPAGSPVGGRNRGAPAPPPKSPPQFRAVSVPPPS